MQRLRVSPERAQLTDGFDIVTFGYTSVGDIRINKQVSHVDPGIPDVITVVGDDNIEELGGWLSTLPAIGTGIVACGAEFVTKDSESLLVAAVSVLSPHDSDLTLLLDNAQYVVDKAGEALGERPRTALDERVFNEGLLRPSRRSALLAKHKAGELTLFSEARYYPIPIPTINQLGSWMLKGKETLVRKSIWSK